MSSFNDSNKCESLPFSDASPFCWLCHEEGPDETTGQPLVRDCSCRGTSGFAHRSCIAAYAKIKARSIMEGNLDAYVFEGWKSCPNCCQNYCNDLAVDLASECVAFVKNEYPDNQNLHVRAHFRKLWLWVPLNVSAVSDESKIEETANEILSIIATIPPALGNQDIEASVYTILGCVAFRKGTKKGFTSAVGYFEKSLDIYKSIGNKQAVATAELNITLAKSNYEGGSAMNTKEELEKVEDFYKQRVEKHGEASPDAIHAGIGLVMAHRKAGNDAEAKELLELLAGICHQVHGPCHNLTKNVESRRSRW